MLLPDRSTVLSSAALEEATCAAMLPAKQSRELESALMMIKLKHEKFRMIVHTYPLYQTSKSLRGSTFVCFHEIASHAGK
mmetsp:Transcript_34743/g.64317  ORF Transcript_34743/g.64317 Transcript_34743/m.64317 type:complete len:80 (+) Transcript_34743:312-551(+)